MDISLYHASRFPRRFLTIIRRRVFQLSDGDSSLIIPEKRLVNMFRKSLFLNRMSMTRAMRYTPPTMKAAPLMLPIASPISTMKANAKIPSTTRRTRVITKTASILLKPTDRPATMFFLKS